MLIFHDSPEQDRESASTLRPLLKVTDRHPLLAHKFFCDVINISPIWGMFREGNFPSIGREHGKNCSNRGHIMKEQQNEGRTFIDQEYKDAAGNPPFRNLSAGDDAE
jgi:hypothetical protein